MKRSLMFAVMFLAAAGLARADHIVTFELDEAVLTYTAAGSTLVITEETNAEFDVTLDDTVSGLTLDSARVTGGANYDFTMTLNLVNEPGVDNWSATGTVVFTDMNTATNAVEADFVSTSVSILGTSFPILELKGLLATQTGNDSILVNRGDPWVYVGQSDFGPGDADGVPNQITVANPDRYDFGDLFVFKFGVATTSLDVLFGVDRSFEDGQVLGGVTTPLPAALPLGILGFAGLALVGRKMRRLA
jgi:hypothetical protein